MKRSRRTWNDEWDNDGKALLVQGLMNDSTYREDKHLFRLRVKRGTLGKSGVRAALPTKVKFVSNKDMSCVSSDK